jgi:hypothetical protein
MAFKMRSGNKSSFKDMGSSPAKIDLSGKLKPKNPYSDGLEGGSDGSTIGEGTKYQRLLNENAALQNTQAANAAQDLAEKNAKKIDENSKKIKPTKAEEETAARKSRTESMNSMPWNKKVKEKLADKTKTATSKREQRANYKAAKENARGEDSPGGTKITKEEKFTAKRNRDITRSNTAAANGDQALSFNWKNAILGGQGLQAGFDIGSKSDKINAKMAKQDANRASKKAAKATKEETNNKATERRSKTTIGKINNNIRKEIKDFPGKVVKAVKNAAKVSKTNTPTTNTSTVTSTVAPTASEIKVNKVKPSDIKAANVKTYTTVDESNNSPSPRIKVKSNVKKEVKEADANKPKYVPSIENEKLKGNLVVNQDLMNKKVPKKEKPVVTVKNKSEKGVLEKQLDDNNENKKKNRVKGVLEEEITKEKLIGPKNK